MIIDPTLTVCIPKLACQGGFSETIKTFMTNTGTVVRI